MDERVAAARGDLHPEEHQAEGDHRDEEEREPGWVNLLKCHSHNLLWYGKSKVTAKPKKKKDGSALAGGDELCNIASGLLKSKGIIQM